MTDEEPNTKQSFFRPAKLSDFFDEHDDLSSKNKYNKNYSHNETIEKNQQEYGQRKRIKP